METRNVENIRKSIQMFQDYANDLMRSDGNTFEDRLNVFVEFCRSDSVFNIIHSQLINNSNVNLDSWYQKIRVPDRQLEFPTNEDDRISLIYQLLLAIREDSSIYHHLITECFILPKGFNINDGIRELSAVVIEPLVRGLSKKLDGVLDGLPSDTTEKVPSAVIQQIFNVRGSLIQQSASGNQNVQTASINSNDSELQRLVNELKDEIRNLSISQSEKDEAMEVADAVEKELQSETPKKSMVSALLKALPLAGNIASIVNDILALLKSLLK